MSPNKNFTFSNRSTNVNGNDPNSLARNGHASKSINTHYNYYNNHHYGPHHHHHSHLHHSHSNNQYKLTTTATNGFKPSHNRARSDTTGIITANSLMPNNRSNSTTSLKLTIGDLMSGRAFDNNCNCLELYLQQQHIKNHVESSESESSSAAAAAESQTPESSASSTSSSASSSSSVSPPPPQIAPVRTINPHLASSFECSCSAPRLAPEFEFTKALIQIGKKLVRLASKELKTQRLMSELAIINMNLPARVWLPLHDFPHHVVRIPYRSAAVLNSKEKAPYIMYVEVLECESVHATPLPPKLLDNNLQSVKSEENLALNSRNSSQSNLQAIEQQVSASANGSGEQVANKESSSPKSIKSLNADVLNGSNTPAIVINSGSESAANSQAWVIIFLLIMKILVKIGKSKK